MKRHYAKAMVTAIMLMAMCGCHKSQEAKSAQEKEMIETIAMHVPASYAYSKESWSEWGRMVVGHDTLEMKVRGRGHSTYDKPKHPYNIKLRKAQRVLGMRAHERWVMLANIFDHSLMRNQLAFEVARLTSLADVTPQWRMVWARDSLTDWGAYLLCERVRDLTKDSLLKIDVYEAEERLKAGQHPTQVPNMPLDTTSFADYWIVNEVCMNAEPNGPRSCYMRIKSDGKLYAGPIWDYDMAFNELGVDDGGDLRPNRFRLKRPEWLKAKQICWLTTDSIYNKTALNYGALLNDENFRHTVGARWRALQPRLTQLNDSLEKWNAMLGKLGTQDQEMWNGKEPARFDDSKSYAEGYRKLKTTYAERIEKLNKMLKDW